MTAQLQQEARWCVNVQLTTLRREEKIKSLWDLTELWGWEGLTTVLMNAPREHRETQNAS